MYPLAIAFRLIGQVEVRSAVRGHRRSSFQAGAAIKARAPSRSGSVGVRSSLPQRDQSWLSASTRGSNAPLLRVRHSSLSWSSSNSSGETFVGTPEVAIQRRNSLEAS